MSNSVLVIDDEQDIRVLIKYNLEQEGFTVTEADNGASGLELAKKNIPDLILLDVMMPGMDGIETCEKLKDIPELANTMICFLTARGEDYSQIAGFDAGADDYITKPIKPKVLVSRIAAILRRKYDGEAQKNDINDNEKSIRIDRERYLITKDGEELFLPRKEFELLALLMSKPGKVFHRDSIMNSVWGTDVVVGDRTIDVHIRKLREKIGDSHIVTVKGVGYKFEN
ncbi:response regulator transcription factor [Crocinitomix catalasitica]|uniref:response regulator transcription factor n=1 Tax=Crocinitomix catalasitica TaxID=184607 RepID=UPI0004890BB0|nr:response regulator transcription factor [Crocinitomix catalasitica]